MACDLATLISDGKCYRYLPEPIQLAIALRLMCALRDGDTTMACTPEALVQESQCLAAKIPREMLVAAMLPVLCDIAAAGGGGGGGGGVSCGSGAPANPPSDVTTCAFYMDESADALYYWNATAGEWRLLLA